MTLGTKPMRATLDTRKADKPVSLGAQLARERTARGLEVMAQIETLYAQLAEARNALRIAQAMTEHASQVERVDYVQRMIAIRQACAIGLAKSQPKE